jgi:hypothetical protein
MEVIEMIGWIALGFIPLFGGLETLSRKLRWRDKTVLRTPSRLGEEVIGL